MKRIDFDNSCSKTTLLAFADDYNAEIFLKRLDVMQRNGIDINRITEDNVIVKNEIPIRGSSIVPLTLETMYINEIERLCLLHFFDMYIVVNIDSDESNDITLMCYENKTYEWPNRSILDRFMKDMYHK